MVSTTNSIIQQWLFPFFLFSSTNSLVCALLCFVMLCFVVVVLCCALLCCVVVVLISCMHALHTHTHAPSPFAFVHFVRSAHRIVQLHRALYRVHCVQHANSCVSISISISISILFLIYSIPLQSKTPYNTIHQYNNIHQYN